ncbi:uncharacterized protein [Watersipora subatra]|uniref:uncharacterized protein isoform X2 n=1 Tax=Watersipora subatra TaxID=2589382 RepID=UPI00355C4F37
MSHNPTYDPEPGYNSYGGDRSGHSTPPRFHSNSTLPVSEPAPYTNMASYRQATTGPANYSDNSAGNGKSYRYATAEPIPEDDVESPVADSRQVQFTDLGTESKIPPKTSRSEGSDKKFLILALVAAVFALLFIIFLGLFIWKNSAAANVNEVGQPGDTGAAVDQTIPPSTATPKVDISEETIGSYGGTDVMKYTLKNEDGMEADILSVGARLNRLKLPSAIIIAEVAGNGSSLDAIVEDTDGAWHGPVCSEGNPTLHKEHFTKDETTMDGSLKLYKELNNMRIEFTFVLEEANKLMVTITGVPKGPTSQNIDICSSHRFNYGGVENIGVRNSIQIPSTYLYKTTGWSEFGTGPNDLNNLNTLKPFQEIIDRILGVNSKEKSVSWEYLLSLPTGMKHAVTIGDGNPAARLNIKTNQAVVNMYLDLEDRSYVKILVQNHPWIFTEDAVSQVKLSSGSTYEFQISYEAV